MSSGTTRGHEAYRSIIEVMRQGIYRPGDALREEEVAARLGVSRTPVREALARLQERGLVEAGKGRGVIVAVLSTQQVFELYAIRGELEGIVARYAAHHATEAEIMHLRQLNDAFRNAGTASAAYEHNRSFHTQLYDACRNRYLRQTVEDLQDTIAILPETTFVAPRRITTGAGEHDDIIDAIMNKDGELAQRLAVEHIKASLAVRLELIREQKQGNVGQTRMNSGPRESDPPAQPDLPPN